MKKSTLSVLALIFTAVFVFSAMPYPAFAAKGGIPVIRTQPQSVTVNEGGSCEFTANQSGATGITWRLRDPKTGQAVLCSQAHKTFQGLQISGKNSECLRLSNVPASLDGWQVYCTFANSQGRIDTEFATLYVNPRGSESTVKSLDGTGDSDDFQHSSGDGFEDEPSGYVRDENASGQINVRLIGCTAQYLDANGRASGGSCTELDFGSDRGNFYVTADSSPAYWLFNGVRYEFDHTVKKFKVQDLSESLVIEAVSAGRGAQTLLSPQELASGRNNGSRVITCKTANMCHIDSSDRGAGGWFKEFDFTYDYLNLATGLSEDGGQVTFRCKANEVEGKKISYWYFNDAKIDFDSNVTSFVVRSLNRSMYYQPVFVKVATPVPTVTAVPITYYNVKCIRCTFTGGGYSGATSGKVPAGTKITVSSSNLVQYWLVNGGVASSYAYWDSENKKMVYPPQSITRTINQDTTIEVPFVVN